MGRSIVGLSLAAIPLGIIPLVAEPPRLATGSFDILGTVLLAVTLMALLVPLSEAGAWAWGDPRTVGLLAGFAVVAVVFVAVERRIASPVIDTRVNARPALLLTNIASVCVGFALFATLIGTANYVEAPRASGYGFGLSIVGSGLCMVPGGLMIRRRRGDPRAARPAGIAGIATSIRV